QVGGSRLQADTCSQDREGDDEAGEARHHDEQPWRHRKHAEESEHLDDVGDGSAVRLGDATQIDLLRCCLDYTGEQNPKSKNKSVHSNSSVRIRTSLACPPLRIAARSRRSALRCW